jgi:hypothetical protein
VLKITGSTTVNLPVADAVEILRERDRNLTIFVDTQGGSSGGVAAIGEGLAQLGMASRPITDKGREKFPQAYLVSTTIGSDALALVVSKDVWEGGVNSLDRDQARGIYEGRFTNWKQLGGPDQEVVFSTRNLAGHSRRRVARIRSSHRRNHRRLPGHRTTRQPATGSGWKVDKLTQSGQTITSKLGGSELNIAYGDQLHWGATMGLALVLLAISAAVSIVGRQLINRSEGINT